MRFAKNIAIIISFFIISLEYKYLFASPNYTQEPYEILFIGSSYFNYNDLLNLFKNLADSAGKKVDIDRKIANGLYLDDHAKSSTTELKIKEKKWDYVILQGVGSITAYPEIFTDHPVYPALKTLQNKISENCESTKMVFCLPWAYEDGMTWLAGWTDTYEDMQIKVYENTLQYSDDLGFIIAPVGWAWNTVLKEKNYPLHYLHKSDWNHPSLKGSYLMACVIFSTIFQESSVDLPYYGGIPEEEANYFQTIASTTVLDSLDLWNIIETDIEKSEFLIPRRFHLYQNYPNPFNPSTTINYEIQKYSLVEIIVYDILGKRYSILENEFKMPGSYSVGFDGSRLNSGVYFYSVKYGNQCLIKKMLLMK